MPRALLNTVHVSSHFGLPTILKWGSGCCNHSADEETRTQEGFHEQLVQNSMQQECKPILLSGDFLAPATLTLTLQNQWIYMLKFSEMTCHFWRPILKTFLTQSHRRQGTDFFHRQGSAVKISAAWSYLLMYWEGNLQFSEDSSADWGPRRRGTLANLKWLQVVKLKIIPYK